MTSDLPPLPNRLAGAFGRPIWNEARAPMERRRLRRRPVDLAPGDGRRVVLVTGYLAGPASASVLADWLRHAGYRVDFAPVGRNAVSSSAAADRIAEALHRDAEPAVLIGHSRGGQQSRVATQRHPDRVGRLITMGAPVRHHLPRQIALRSSVEALRLLGRLPVGPDDDPEGDAVYEAELLSPYDVDVPWTAIWSKVDGVVEWQACLDPAADLVEVSVSHTGMLASVPTFEAIAAALHGD